MEESKKRSLVITLPRFEWRWIYETRIWFLISICSVLSFALYWWISLFPYLWITNAYVETYLWRAPLHSGSHITALGPDVGDLVKKGDLLYSLDSDWIREKQEQLQETSVSLEEQILEQKARMDRAMQDYLGSVQESEYSHHHLIALEEAQTLSEKVTRDLQSVKSELSFLESEMKKMSVEAPFEGIVGARIGEIGSLVSVDQPIYTLIDLKKIWIRAQIPEERMAHVRLGGVVRVRLTAFPKKEFKGTISWIDPTAINGSIGVKIFLDGQHPSLKPGLTAQIALKVH